MQVIDQLHRTIEVPHKPQRIVSVVPSQTELLYDLGLRDEVVGITRFCIHPDDWFRQKTRIGGTKKLHIEKIHALQPDLILANKEENTKEEIEQLAQHYPVWKSNIANLTDALQMIQQVGRLVGWETEATLLQEKIQHNFATLHTTAGLKTLYLIWYKPYMSIGTDTFIHQIMTLGGFENCIEKTRYPVLTNDDIRALQPQVILLSSEPFPFQQKHIDELQTIVPHASILLVDGELFSWYGSRLIQTPDYLTQLKHTIDSHL